MNQKSVSDFDQPPNIGVEQIDPQGTVQATTIEHVQSHSPDQGPNEGIADDQGPARKQEESTLTEASEAPVSSGETAAEADKVAAQPPDDQVPLDLTTIEQLKADGLIPPDMTLEQIKRELEDDRKHNRSGWGRMTIFNF